MSCEGEGSLDQSEKPPVNVSRVVRQLERRFMGRDAFGLRDYRTSLERAIEPSPYSESDLTDQRVVATITFKPDEGTVVIERVTTSLSQEDMES